MVSKKQISWNLDGLYKAEEFEKKLKETEEELKKFDEWWEKISPEMAEEEFKKLLVFLEEFSDKLAILGGRPGLAESVDQKDREAKLQRAKIEELGLRIADKTRKFDHWIKGLPLESRKTLDDKNAKRLFGVIADLKYGLEKGREAAKHTLSQKEERIIDYKDTFGIGPLNDLREMVVTEWDFDLKIGKKIKKIKTQSDLMALVHSPKREIRKAAYKALWQKYGKNIDKLFLVYSNVVKDWGFEAKARNYKSPIGVRNFGNNIPDEAVETLMEVCREKKPIFERYFKTKAKILGLKKLSRWDVYAPTGVEVDKKIDYTHAKEIVLENFNKFGPKFFEYAKEILDKKHVDVFPRPSKRSGAFCATISPRIAPYVMLNHTNKLRDVMTLAHELGHGVHSLFGQNHYPSAQHAGLPLAETASTLGEMMVFEEIYKNSDKKTKKALLVEKMADSYATILRQNYFVMFEKEAHEKIPGGIRVEELNKMYLDNLKDQFGGSVVVSDDFKYEWAYVSHIFETPFYCYAYNFGQLVSYYLYSRYKNEGKGFVKVIEKILEAGGSRDPDLVLKEVGIDMRDRNFWVNAFGVVESWQKELEGL
ncbi:MAG: M3 family oligoendopeptidase [Candidatus Shapirobacteria bacterium]|jgi:oligoendopeptidase F